MRRQRIGLIQTPDQLRFSYKAILDGVKYLLDLEETEGPDRVSFSESDSEEENEEPPPIPPRDPDIAERLKALEKEGIIPAAAEEKDEGDDGEKLLKRTRSMPEEEPPHKREKLDNQTEDTTVGARCGTSESEGSSEWELINEAEEPNDEEETENRTSEATDERER